MIIKNRIHKAHRPVMLQRTMTWSSLGQNSRGHKFIMVWRYSFPFGLFHFLACYPPSPLLYFQPVALMTTNNNDMSKLLRFFGNLGQGVQCSAMHVLFVHSKCTSLLFLNIYRMRSLIFIVITAQNSQFHGRRSGLSVREIFVLLLS